MQHESQFTVLHFSNTPLFAVVANCHADVAIDLLNETSLEVQSTMSSPTCFLGDFSTTISEIAKDGVSCFLHEPARIILETIDGEGYCFSIQKAHIPNVLEELEAIAEEHAPPPDSLVVVRFEHYAVVVPGDWMMLLIETLQKISEELSEEINEDRMHFATYAMLARNEEY